MVHRVQLDWLAALELVDQLALLGQRERKERGVLMEPKGTQDPLDHQALK